MFIAVGIGAFLIIAVIGFLIVGIYNSLIAVKENITQAWANIDVILKQRYDEVPKLVKLCEQYMTYESGMIDKIMSARENMVKGPSEKRMEASNELTAGLGGLLAIGEGYPELKANENFLQLQNRISELEESLADRREYYNNCVNVYNIRIQQIPDVFIAGRLGYTSKTMFEVKSFEKESPSVDMKMPK